MINKLRRKFIVVSMCAVAAVLAVVMIVAYIVSYAKINQSFDQKLHMLAENDGRFPMWDYVNRPGEPGMGGIAGSIRPDWPGMSPESPYETRFFTVSLDASGNVKHIDIGFIAAIEAAEAVEYAKAVLQSGKTKGYIDIYRYLRVNRGGDSLVVFLDCSRDLSSQRTFVIISIMVSVGSLLAVFLLLTVLSKYAIAPMAESYQKQKQFITDASHELKTPLTIISANNEVIELESGSSQWTESIRNQVARMTELTGNLVALARMDEEGKKPEMVDFSLSDVLTETAGAFAVPAEKKAISFEVATEAEITCRGNEPAIRQLISLLCDNAVKYTNHGGNIKVSLNSQGKRSLITVCNTVDKIEKGRHDRLFERFYRADTSRNSDTGGSGIGLSMAKAIVEAHKGRITAVSEDGKSLMVRIWL